MKQNNEKINEEVTKGFNPLNRAELVLAAHLKCWYTASGHLAMGNNGFYYAGDYRYISYRQKRLDDEKIAFMLQVYEDPYTFSIDDEGNRNYKIFSFMHVRKNYEHKITQALVQGENNAHHYWERWCLLSNGTILEPMLTERLIKKVEIQSDQNLKEEDDYLNALLSVNSKEQHAYRNLSSAPIIDITEDEITF